MREAFDSLKTRGYDFNYIAEMDIITLAHKRDMTSDFYIKHNMPAVEWRINQIINKYKILYQIINKDKILLNKLPVTWVHHLNRKFESFCT